MTHHIVWTFDDNDIEQAATCDDPECIHRYVCIDGACEVYYDVKRADDGTVTHKQWDDDDRPIIQRHRMENRDECMLLDYLNADPWVLRELNDGHQKFEIGRTEIEPVWQGEDGALWRARTSSASSNGAD